ncbi:MAG: LamG domain-containing protein [Candidatus Aenigmarchaeota archaeon]|nr:LamG domain-containing protein [Candidatus Aenigmarchaeota archaeon]
MLASNAPSVLLISPPSGNVSPSNVTIFTCNGTDDQNVYKIGLYHNLGGSFQLNQTQRVMELENDVNTTLLCRFDGSYACEDGEVGTNTNTDFLNSTFMTGVRVNDTDSLRYPVFGNLEMAKGTVEFWVKVGFTPSETVWLFSTGASNVNDLIIKVQSGTIYFLVYDNQGDFAEITRNVSSWNIGEWHHVAAVWSVVGGAFNDDIGTGNKVNLFIDGSDQSTTVNDQYNDVGNIGTYFYLGSDQDGQENSYQSKSVFDEFRVSNKVRNRVQINQSFLKGTVGHTNETLNVTVGNITDGTYSWNCLVTDNETQATWAGQNLSFSIDTTTPPTVNSITLAPNNSDIIDPGTRINFTANVTDPSNVTSATFQYRYDIDWNNVTMNNIGGTLWNASVTTVSGERTYYYRVLSNDSRNNSNVSQNYTVNSTYDYTWTRSPSYLEAFAPINSLSNVGILTINNTGDDTLIVTLSDNWPISDVYYNTTEQFTVASGANRSVNITANFAPTSGSSNMTVTISTETAAVGKTTSPTQSSLVVNMNSFTGGPSILSEMVSVPSSVTQSQTGVSLSARVRNIGNDTAQNVWINWTLPAGWTNTSGLVSKYVGNLSAATNNVSTITVSLDTSAYSGVLNVCANSSASGNLSSTGCTIIQVSCSSSDGVCGLGCTFNTDLECPSSTSSNSAGSSSSGGGASSAAAFREEVDLGRMINAPEQVSVAVGETEKFKVGILNVFRNVSMRNVRIVFDGPVSDYISVAQKVPLGIPSGSVRNFDSEVGIPEFFAHGTYEGGVTVYASVVEAGREREMVQTKKMRFAVTEINGEEAEGLMASSVSSVQKMVDMGIPVRKALRILGEANASLARSDYDGVKEAAERIGAIERDMEEAGRTIAELRSSLGSYAAITGAFLGPNRRLVETENLLNLAEAAMKREDHELAAKRSREARAALILETTAFDPVFFLVNYWWAVLTTLLAASAASVFAHREYSSRVMRSKMLDLQKEERGLTSTMAELQSSYFKGSMGADAFRSGMDGSRKRLVEVRRGMVDLRHRRARLLRPDKLIEDLESERSELVKSMSSLQKKYFVDSGIGKGIYSDQISSYEERLAEIESEIETLKLSGGSGK